MSRSNWDLFMFFYRRDGGDAKQDEAIESVNTRSKALFSVEAIAQYLGLEPPDVDRRIRRVRRKKRKQSKNQTDEK